MWRLWLTRMSRIKERQKLLSEKIKMEYYGNNDYWDYLSHHGILGMRWGKRNGPPYPLGSGDHSVSEKKAGWRKSLRGRNEKLYSRPKITKNDLRNYKQKVDDENDKTLPKEKDLEQQAKRKELAKKIIISTAVAAGIGAGIYLAYKHASVEDMAKLGDNLTKEKAAEIMTNNLGDQFLPKGSEIHRMASEAGIDFSKVKSPTYAAFKEKDVLTYMSQLKDWTGTGKRYDVTFKAVKDIRMPSKEKAREIFEELWTKDPKYKVELKKTLTDTYTELYIKQYKTMGLEVDPSFVRRAAMDQVSRETSSMDSAFDSAIYSVVRRGSDTKRFIGELSKRGYDAIEDYFDKGTMADSPIILFDPSSSVVKTGEKEVTSAMKVLALMKLAKK